MPQNIKKVLIIGSGADKIGHETELDAATYQVGTSLQQLGITTILIDNNPFSFALDGNGIDQIKILPITLSNIVTVINEFEPDAILPNLGGLDAIRLMQELIETGILREQNIKLLGIPDASIRQINNPVLLNQTLKQMKAPTTTSKMVRDFEGALTITSLIGFPVIIKPVAPSGGSTRRTCHDNDELADAISTALGQSRVGQAMVQQSIAGYKEIELVVLRDRKGTTMQIAAIEDFDPIGIHAGDSIAFAPTQTLLDREVQELRNWAFAITRKLRIVGVNHVQFALNSATGKFYVIKNSPYFDRMTAFAARTTGYPLAIVCANLVAGKTLSEVKLPASFAPKTALIEPAMDHIAARVPIWPFDVLPAAANKAISTQMHSTGSTIGIGRSTEEALMKAIRATQFHAVNFTIEQQRKLSDDQMVQLLIHPRANRIMVLMEALRRGYSISELAELTKIDPFYFHKLKKMQQLEQSIANQPGDNQILRQAKYYGFSDRFIGQLWQLPEKDIAALQAQDNIKPTYKEVDPSAGEFEQHSGTFFATFEQENESTPINQKKALVVGSGGFRLGNGGAADYFTASILQQLKSENYFTILLNNNPNSISMSPALSDKQYIEPLETPDIMQIVALEQPDIIYLPNIRKRLYQELKNLDLPIVLLPQNGAILSHMASGAEFAFNAIFDGKHVYSLGIAAYLIQNKSGFGEPTAMVYPADLSQSEKDALTEQGVRDIQQQPEPGLYQTLFVKTDRLHKEQTRIITLPEISFLSKTLGISLSKIATSLVNPSPDVDLALENVVNIQVKQSSAFASTFPFKSLQLYDEPITANTMVGAEMAFGDSTTEALQHLNVQGKFQFHAGSLN